MATSGIRFARLRFGIAPRICGWEATDAVRILIVEDNAEIGGLLLEFVRESGHASELVPSAEAALARLRTDRPDLVLLDFRLPGMSGLDFLRLRPVRDSRVPVVVVSGIANERDVKECLRLGAVDFVPKPIPFARLRQILDLFEPLALAKRREVAGRPVERRRAPRVRVAMPVEVREYGSVDWQTTSVDLSPGGIKVLPVWAAPESAVKLSVALPDDDERLEIVSVLLRVDLDGYAFYFANLTEWQIQRLTQLIHRLNGQPPP
jgi:DNA-binding response OmpR family regulator